MDNDVEDCVYFGRALERAEGAGGRKLHLAVAEGRAKQAVPPWQQEARDEEGRRRFHGAFTGGFSAGYFNSVGSKEGWQPASFRSSRSQRAEVQPQRVEALMDADERDDAQRGAVAAHSAFDTFGFTAAERARHLAPAADRRPSVIPEGAVAELLASAADSIGAARGEGREEAGGGRGQLDWMGWLVAVGLAADCWECNVEMLSLHCLPVHSTLPHAHAYLLPPHFPSTSPTSRPSPTPLLNPTRCTFPPPPTLPAPPVVLPQPPKPGKALLRRMGWREGRGLGPDEVAASRKVQREGRRAMLALAAGGRGRGEGRGDEDGEAEGEEDEEEGDTWEGRGEIVGKGRGARGGKDGGALAAAAAAEAAVAAQLRAPKRDNRGVGFDAFQGAEDVRGPPKLFFLPVSLTLFTTTLSSLLPAFPPPCLARLSVLWGVGAEHRQRTAGGAREGGRVGEPVLGGRRRAGGSRQSLFAAGSGRVAGGFGIGALEEAGAEDEDIYDSVASPFSSFTAPSLGTRSGSPPRPPPPCAPEIPAGELHEVEEDEDEGEGEGPRVLAGGGFMVQGRRGQQGMVWMGGVGQGRGSGAAVLRGFCEGRVALEECKWYPPPHVPPSFTPHHVFPSSAPPTASPAPFPVAPPPAPPPADVAVRAAVEGVAAMVARCGAHVEALLLSRAGGGVGEGAREGMVQGASTREEGGGEGSVRLAFLVGGEGSAYYRRRVWELAERQRAAQGRAAAGKAMGSSGGERLGPDGRGALLGEQPLPSTQPAPAPPPSAHPTPTSTASPAAAASAFTSAASPPAPPAPTAPAFQQHGAAAELAAMMAARFHSSGHEDRAGKDGMSTEKAALPAATIADTALAGAAAVVVARRREEAWRPLPLLCKRFKLPDPYAGKAPPPPLHRPSQLDTLTSFPQTLPSSTPAPTAAPSPLLSLPAPPPAAPAMPPERDGWMGGPEEGHMREAIGGGKDDTGRGREENAGVWEEEGEGQAAAEAVENRPMDLFKAIFSDDEDSDDDACATSAAPGGIDDVAAAEAATRALARLEAGDFLEGLGEELGLQVDPGEVRRGAGGEGRREEREGSKGAKRESKAGKGRAGKEHEGGVWGQGGDGAGMAGSAGVTVEAGRVERAREGGENVAGGRGASEAPVGQSERGGSGDGMGDAHGGTRGGAMGEGRGSPAAAAAPGAAREAAGAVAAVNRKKRVLTSSSSSSSATSGSDSDSEGSLSGGGERRRRRRKEGEKTKSKKRSRETDGGEKRRKRRKRRDSGSTGSEDSDDAARRRKTKQHKKKASRRKRHRGRHGSSSEEDYSGSDSSSERRRTKSKRRHGDKGGRKRRNK
ncbi:unnamed protein product [Closterium sp. NIES-53]